MKELSFIEALQEMEKGNICCLCNTKYNIKTYRQFIINKGELCEILDKSIGFTYAHSLFNVLYGRKWYLYEEPKKKEPLFTCDKCGSETSEVEQEETLNGITFSVCKECL